MMGIWKQEEWVKLMLELSLINMKLQYIEVEYKNFGFFGYKPSDAEVTLKFKVKL